MGIIYGLINYTMKVTFQKFQTSRYGNVLQSIPTVINGVRCGDTEAVARTLEDISQSIQDMTDALKMMQGSCSDAHYNFYNFSIYISSY